MANYLTQDDVNNYGHELVDFSQRAAIHALTPTLQQINQQTAELHQRLAREARYRLDQQVEQAVPNYREIDIDSRWHRWLLGVDSLSGRVRQALLNYAIRNGAADRVIFFFRSFQQEEQAADQAPPGRARPAASAPNKPIYTRAQIGQLYEQHRKGQFSEGEWARREADVFAAQHEGRIQGAPYFTK